MISVYLNFPGNAAEAAHYYAQVFDAPQPEIMTLASVPQADREQMGLLPEDFTVHANVATFGGNLMLSDAFPGAPVTPGSMVNLTFSHPDKQRLRKVFDRLAQDGEVEMPLAPTFFSPLFGSVKDRFGLIWLVMIEE